MRRISVAAGLLMCCVGCAYDKPEFYTVGTSETCFLLPMEGNTEDQQKVDSEHYYKERMVQLKRVQVPHVWVKQGYGALNGYYQDTVRLVAVDRSPVTSFWTPDGGGGNAIWAESKDSVGFSTGITMTARILTDDDAATFLYNYPAVRQVEDQGEERDSMTDAKFVVNLQTVMDKEIRARVAKVLAEFAANEMMDDLREQKVAMLDAVEADIVPFFKARGIDITSVGQFGGFSYENTEIQKAIDNVFQAQQDQRVAVAETEAQVERNKAIQLAAEGKAAAVKAEADGKASAIQAVADARKYEIDQLQANPEMYMRLMNLEIQKAQLEKWNGTYPSTLMTMGTGETPPFILELPKQDLSKR